MIKTINIDVDYEAMGVEPSPRQSTLTQYIVDDTEIIPCTPWKKRPAVVVCPGGGYEFTSEREATPISYRFAAAGFNVFELKYSIKPSMWPAAICEVSKTIAYIRETAEETHTDPNKVFVCGFSAGGHLTASIGVHYNHPDVLKFSGVKEGENKPNGLILAYPVITSEEGKTHQGSIDNITGGKAELRELMSLEKHVTPETPQSFIWHTYTDACVPVVNSLRFANALEENGVPFELHIYPDGPHGLSLADESVAGDDYGIKPEIQGWIDNAVRWIKSF